jgi:hypothetical protein
MITPKLLSPAAQAVLDAYETTLGVSPGIAAALRAAAAQIAAEEVPPHVKGDAYWPWRNGRATAEEHLLAIATELEGHRG